MTPGRDNVPDAALALAEAIKPMLRGLDPSIQGAALAELASLWLVGHSPVIRADAFAHWLDLLRGLVALNGQYFDALHDAAGPNKPPSSL